MRESEWEFVTSNSFGIGVGCWGAEGGSITLREPKTKKEVPFYYGALGAGKSFGVKLPKLKNVKLPAAVGSIESFPSVGAVFMTTQFQGKELSRTDIGGGFAFVEISGGVAWGEAGYAIMFGMDPEVLAAVPLNPAFLHLANDGAKGYLFFRGMTYGLQLGGGGAGFAGLMYPH